MKFEELLAIADEYDCREYFDPLDPEFDMALVKMVEAIVEKNKSKIFIDEVAPLNFEWQDLRIFDDIPHVRGQNWGRGKVKVNE